MSLPPTVAARRNARLRAAALATIPLILFVLAAIPRLWAPDLVPFGSERAELVSAARAHAADTWAQVYADPTWPALALVEPLLRDLPLPVATWVLLRGLLDALGVALIYLAARPLVGAFGGAAAGLLVAANPAAWAAVRDPAGPLGLWFAAAALLVAVQVVERPTPVRGAILGVLLGLLARSLPLGLLVVPLGAAALAFGRASWRIGGLTALGLVLAAGPALFAGYDRLTSGLITSLYALRLPAWLLTGTAYRSPQGHLAGTVLPWEHEAPIAALTVALVVGGAVLAVHMARRGRPAALLVLVWLIVSWLGAVAVVDPFVMSASSGRMGEGASFTEWTTWRLDAAGPIVVLSPLVVVLVLSTTTRFVVARWAAAVGILALLVLGSTTIWLSQRNIERVVYAGNAFGRGVRSQWQLGPEVTVGWPPGLGLGELASLREWRALADAARESAARAGTDEVVVAGELHTAVAVKPLAALLGDDVSVRQISLASVLPLEGEIVFVVSSGAEIPVELQRPSSSIRVYTDAGVDTGARILTLRPRSPADWLSLARPVPNGRFADGSEVVGVEAHSSHDGANQIALYLRLTTETSGREVGEVVSAVVGDDVSRLYPSGAPILLQERRSGELTVVRMKLIEPPAEIRPHGPHLPPVLRLRLTSRNGSVIRTSSGADALDVPLSAPSR